MAHSQIHNVDDGVWFVDSGCSNHMSCSNSLFKNLDESMKSEVRLGNDTTIKVEVAIKTEQGDTKQPLRNNWPTLNRLYVKVVWSIPS